MKRSDITLHARHRDKLQALLAHPRGHEGAAYMLLGKSEIAQDPWDLEPRTRYTSYEVIAIPHEDRVDASDKHVTWNTNSFAQLCRRAKEEGLVRRSFIVTRQASTVSRGRTIATSVTSSTWPGTETVRGRAW